MEKKDCKFSLTQFEFELVADDDLRGGNKKWENLEMEYFNKYLGAQSVVNTPEAAKPEQVSVRKVIFEPVAPEPAPGPTQAPEKKQRKKRQLKQKPEPIEEPTLEPEEVVQPAPVVEKKTRSKRGDAWERNYELYKNGERSNLLHAWVSLNRKMFKTGKLTEDKFEKLMEINFPFEILKKGRPKKQKPIT